MENETNNQTQLNSDLDNVDAQEFDMSKEQKPSNKIIYILGLVVVVVGFAAWRVLRASNNGGVEPTPTPTPTVTQEVTLLPTLTPTLAPQPQGKIAFIRNGNVWFSPTAKDSDTVQVTKDGKCLTGFDFNEVNDLYSPNYEYPCYRSLSWSPNGRKFLYSRAIIQYPVYENKMYIYDYSSQDTYELNTEIGYRSGAVWSADSTKFVGRKESSIILVNVSARESETLLDFDETGSCGGASGGLVPVYDEEARSFQMNNGHTLIWVEDQNLLVIDTNCWHTDIKTFNYSSGEVYEWPKAVIRAVASPDNSQAVAFVNAGDESELHIYDIFGNLLHQYSFFNESPNAEGKFPVWNEDGSVVHFVSNEEIWSFNLESEAFTRLYETEFAYIVHLSMADDTIYFTKINYDQSDKPPEDINDLRNIYKLELQNNSVSKIYDSAGQAEWCR
ncbi:DPP IV N-terminal domain-containing protein [Patescibacteria group bacterium]|nr:DPP IV N-terminal domain-containing protein [Patescibacteria group bacterium]